MNLWNAAQAIGILNAAIGSLGSRNGAVGQQHRHMIRAVYLARVRARCMQARIEWNRRAPKRFHGKCSRCLRSHKESFKLIQLQTRDRKHCLRAIQQRDALLALQLERFKALFLQAFQRRPHLSAIFSLAFADESQRHMSEGRKVTAGAYAAARWNNWRNAMIQKVADALRNHGPNPGMALGEHTFVGAGSPSGRAHYLPEAAASLNAGRSANGRGSPASDRYRRAPRQ